MTTEQAAPTFKPKKSVALSGVTAGNTALCTVGKTGNDLHYRGYDILELADQCEFEEVAHLLVHGKLPTRAELKGYKAKLKALRGLPANVKAALEQLPAASHPMDVMRTGVSVLGCVQPEKDDHNHPGARDIADKLMADGLAPDTPVAVIERATLRNMRVLRGLQHKLNNRRKQLLVDNHRDYREKHRQQCGEWQRFGEGFTDSMFIGDTGQ